MPGVIGIVLIAFTKRLFGARVSTLLGIRLSFKSPERKVVILRMELPALSRVEGALTRLDPIRPTQLLARSLPRNGAEMKIARPISGRCWKMRDSVKISLASGESGTCSGGFLKSFIQSLSPV